MMNRAYNILLALVGVVLCCSTISSAEEKIYKLCVPEMYYEDCLNLMKDPSEAGIKMTCVAGRDRIDCLDMINQQKADVLASEPEDMYVAYHNKNDNYRVISEIRTQEDKDAAFRYEGVILVKKNSNIHSLNDLKGAKSCHTGFGRNVGFKIPVTKLKNAHILQVSMEPELTSTERELKALSEFFSESCIVGRYSPYADVDLMLKKKYSNLCALCEKPEQCNYPDKYSGYDGAIRCLDKGKGDVAFTKVQFIKKYFGLKPETTAEGDPTDFEYLCEDGTRRALTETACSWAQRPWAGYISNTEAVNGAEKLHNLQNRLEKFFENGLHANNKESAAHLMIKENAIYHAKPVPIAPEEYLEKAGYKDVIERDGTEIKKMRMCVETDIEMSKCNAMRRAAYSRDIRPELECIKESNCMLAIQKNNADLASVSAYDYQTYRSNQMKPLVYESYADDNVYVAVVPPRLEKELLDKTPINFDENNQRAQIAAIFLNKKRGLNICDTKPDPAGQIQIVHASKLENHKNYLLLCPNLEQKPVTEFRTCNVEASLPKAIFVSEKMTPLEQDTVKHLFISLSEDFGRNGKLADVFKLFGEFEKGKTNVLFDDDATQFVTELKNVNEETYKSLQCIKVTTLEQNF